MCLTWGTRPRWGDEEWRPLREAPIVLAWLSRATPSWSSTAPMQSYWHGSTAPCSTGSSSLGTRTRGSSAPSTVTPLGSSRSLASHPRSGQPKTCPSRCTSTSPLTIWTKQRQPSLRWARPSTSTSRARHFGSSSTPQDTHSVSARSNPRTLGPQLRPVRASAHGSAEMRTATTVQERRRWSWIDTSPSPSRQSRMGLSTLAISNPDGVGPVERQGLPAATNSASCASQGSHASWLAPSQRARVLPRDRGAILRRIRHAGALTAPCAEGSRSDRSCLRAVSTSDGVALPSTGRRRR